MRPAALAALALVVPLLTGCGGQDYCETVRAHQSELGSIANAGSPTGALQALPILQALQSKAPGDVQDDYQLVVTRIQALQQALDDAGVNPSTYDAKHPPANVSSAERKRILDAAAQLAASDTVQALATIQQEVLDVCHTPLGI
jgi:hypothetical protein